MSRLTKAERALALTGLVHLGADLEGRVNEARGRERALLVRALHRIENAKDKLRAQLTFDEWFRAAGGLWVGRRGEEA
jgi:hypothetical protein